MSGGEILAIENSSNNFDRVIDTTKLAIMSDSSQLCVEQQDRDDQVVSISVNAGEEDGKKPTPDGSDHSKTDGGDVPVPNSHLCQKIIRQVEFYFSDANLQKDHFLRSHMRQSKARLGYVSLKLIATFKKMKALTKDVQVIAYSLRQSEELEVNEEGTEVRSRKPLPDYDTSPARTVVAVNLGHDSPTVGSVTELFKHCGDIALVRVLRPGQSVPRDVAKFAKKHPEIGFNICGLVEFKTQEQATHACQTMTNNKDWRCGMRVVLLDNNSRKKQEKREIDASPKQTKNTTNARKKERISNGGKKTAASVNSSGSSSDGNSSGDVQDPTAVDPNPKHTQRRHSPRSSRETESGAQSHHSEANGNGRQPSSNVPLNNGAHRPSNPKSSSDSKFKRRHKREPCQKQAPSPSSNPWLQRRLQAAQSSGAGTDQGHVPNMVGVLRQPTGPDGTKGFYGGVGRGSPRSSTVT